MAVGVTRPGAVVVAVVSAAAALLAVPGVGHAQEPVCPEGLYWNVEAAQCVDVNVYVNPAPVIGPAGPVGVGGVVGPVGPGPVGPGPVGPGPMGPGR